MVCQGAVGLLNSQVPKQNVLDDMLLKHLPTFCVCSQYMQRWKPRHIVLADMLRCD